MIGLRHGKFCIGCCWALMAVMFVVGAMSLFWMEALTLFLLAEKVAPAGWHIARKGTTELHCGHCALAYILGKQP
jgi:predicted metal-binding membrane protein